MSTYQSTLAHSQASDAAYRAWCAGIITALTSVGLVRTADTGQINAETVLAPTAARTSSGYAIFRFNDAAQSTYPLFLKVEFYSGAYATVGNGAPHLYLTIGKGTDGAGNLSGTLFADFVGYRDVSTASNSGSTTAYPVYASGGEGYAALITGVGISSNLRITPAFIIERTSGGQGLLVMHHATTTSSNARTLGTSGNLYSNMAPAVRAISYATGSQNVGLVPVILPYNIAGVPLGASSALAAGTLGPIFPWVVFPPGLAPHQSAVGMTYPGGDAPTGLFTARVGGSEKTFIAIPLSDATFGYGVSIGTYIDSATANSGYAGLAIRWE